MAGLLTAKAEQLNTLSLVQLGNKKFASIGGTLEGQEKENQL